MIVEFLVSKVKNSQRPNSLLCMVTAALKHFAMAKFGHDPFNIDTQRFFTKFNQD